MKYIYSSLLFWWPQLRLKVNFSNSTIFMISENDPRKRVAEIELYHTLTLIFSQPQEFVNKYFSHNPHWWSCVGWPKRSHRIHWQDWILQFFTMVCLIFHTVIIINRKNWRITTKLHFGNISIFLKKQTYAHARTTPPPSPSKYNLLDTELNSPFGGAD